MTLIPVEPIPELETSRTRLVARETPINQSYDEKERV